jgi:hypothetical protein
MSKSGGRVKGTPNKDTVKLQDKAAELGVDPFEILLLFAKGDWKALGYEEFQERSSPDGSMYRVLTIEPDTRARYAAKACEFLYPKRKALDVSIDDETKKGLTLAYSDPKKTTG